MCIRRHAACSARCGADGGCVPRCNSESPKARIAAAAAPRSDDSRTHRQALCSTHPLRDLLEHARVLLRAPHRLWLLAKKQKNVILFQLLPRVPRPPEVLWQLQVASLLRGLRERKVGRANKTGAMSAPAGYGASNGGGVRARAQGVIQKAGTWPCKLASVAVSGKGNKGDDAPEGTELHRLPNQPHLPPACKAGQSPGQSPTSVTDAAWDFMPRGGICIDSVAAALQGGSSASVFLAGESGIGEKGAMANQTNQRYGGGVFASIRGAHNSWQVQTENDASQVRQKAALSLALGKSKCSTDPEASDASQAGKLAKDAARRSSGNEREGVAPAAGGRDTGESLMCRLMKGLQEQDAVSWAKMTRTPPSGYTGVRASAFALVSSNAVASGRQAPERHCEAPPRVPLHQASTKEGLAGMTAAASSNSHPPRSAECDVSILTARRPESAISFRKSAAHVSAGAEW